ncbi:hypothetical protein ACFV2X_41820 [Streptomyces sp. NPDC059679]|uniref:hypothetical protein n=1 Tax=Streptomyces sp. NPDC059679 TaxID=3346903 RepID=UPI0036A30F92
MALAADSERRVAADIGSLAGQCAVTAFDFVRGVQGLVCLYFVPVAAWMSAQVRQLLEVAPAYLSDREATDRLTLLCEEIGERLENALAARCYAATGDRRALYSTVL